MNLGVLVCIVLLSAFALNVILAFFSWYSIRFGSRCMEVVLINDENDTFRLKERQWAVAARIAEYEIELKENKCYSL